jgi:hypothetical protein
MSTLPEQHVCIKFHFKLGETFTKAFERSQKVFGDETVSHMMTHEWYRRFKDGQTSTEDNSHSERPSTSTNDDSIEQVHDAIIQIDA